MIKLIEDTPPVKDELGKIYKIERTGFSSKEIADFTSPNKQDDLHLKE